MYFGSVRFFKNLILIAVCVLIAVPTVFAFKYRSEAAKLREQTTLLSDDAAAHESPDTTFEPEGSATDAAGQGGQAAGPFTADAPSYQALYEDFYAPESFHATTRIPKTVYLTFDDGPSERTDEILRVLAQKDVKATFFVIGQDKEDNLERMRRIVAEGHTIGMHSFTHDYGQVYASVESFLADFYQNFCQIRDATGVTPTVFRCPGGSINGYDGGIYQEILSEMMRRGFVPYDWNVSSEDAASNRTLSVDELVNNVMNRADGNVRSIILFHDSASKTTSVQAIAPIIDQLRALNYTFEPLSPDIMPVLYSYPES